MPAPRVLHRQKLIHACSRRLACGQIDHNGAASTTIDNRVLSIATVHLVVAFSWNECVITGITEEDIAFHGAERALDLVESVVSVARRGFCLEVDRGWEWLASKGDEVETRTTLDVVVASITRKNIEEIGLQRAGVSSNQRVVAFLPEETIRSFITGDCVVEIRAPDAFDPDELIRAVTRSGPCI